MTCKSFTLTGNLEDVERVRTFTPEHRYRLLCCRNDANFQSMDETLKEEVSWGF